MHRHFFLSSVAVSALFVACVSDNTQPPDSGGPDGNGTETGGGPDAMPETSTPDATITDASVDAVDDSPGDVAVEAEAGKPQPTCVNEGNVSGAYVHVGCQANPSTVSPGGLFALGDYVNSGLYGVPYCPIAYAIGSGTVFQENGGTFLRYAVTRKTSTQDPGTTTYGTFLIETNGNGNLTVTEMCDTQNKGLVKTGTLAISSSVYRMTWMNGNTVIGQESWTKQ
jgi:hypothetical protein